MRTASPLRRIRASSPKGRAKTLPKRFLAPTLGELLSDSEAERA